MTLRARNITLAAALAATLSASPVSAWEGDVHYGLTLWLAKAAGFQEREARVIATGNHRVDAGDMQFIDPLFLYACLSDTEGESGKRAGGDHYPSAGAYPGAPATRTVQAGGAPARQALDAALKTAPQQAGFMLQKLGEALHPFQDSWAHQGTPDAPSQADLGFACDPAKAWAHPKERGGWTAHKADLTAAWPNDTLAMAQATYDALTRYPDVAGAKRTPKSWDTVRAALDGFVKATTKAAKAKWFRAQGFDDVSFLEGATLKDGGAAFVDIWPGRRFPPVPTHQTRQHHVDAKALDFFHAFFADWVAATDFTAVATKHAAPALRAEIASRLKLWRLRDHGRVADLAHTPKALTPPQRATIDAAAKEKDALATFPDPMGAYFPILPRTGSNEVSPLLPFYVKVLPDGAGKPPRAVAMVKFRQAPYDLIAVLAEKSGEAWRVVSITAAVDH